MAKQVCHHLFCLERRKNSGVGFYCSGAFLRARATHDALWAYADKSSQVEINIVNSECEKIFVAISFNLDRYK